MTTQMNITDINNTLRIRDIFPAIPEQMITEMISFINPDVAQTYTEILRLNETMSNEQLVDNAMAAIEHMATKYCVANSTYNNIYNIAAGATNVIDLPIWSVPVTIQAASDPQPVVVVAAAAAASAKPVVKEKKSKEVETSPLATVDIASVPVKQLRKVQAARAEEAKKQVVAEKPKRARRA